LNFHGRGSATNLGPILPLIVHGPFSAQNRAIQKLKDCAMPSDTADRQPHTTESPGGYDDGYKACPCFWGTSPGSLVRKFLEANGVEGLRVLDLGCGERKNAFAFAEKGATVVAVDCSERAIRNGQAAFGSHSIRWVRDDSCRYIQGCDEFDIVVMYGLLHCLTSEFEIQGLIASALEKTRLGGSHIVASFNDGPHDLSAHPNFKPTLLPHDFYLNQYATQTVEFHENAVIHEIHPHNGIPHFHSLTRLLATRSR
jgi:tellurite methyltransferase